MDISFQNLLKSVDGVMKHISDIEMFRVYFFVSSQCYGLPLNPLLPPEPQQHTGDGTLVPKS